MTIFSRLPAQHVGESRNIQVIEKTFEPLSDKRILDVGCGRGNLLKALLKRGAIPTGIDVNENSIVQAKSMWPEVNAIRAGIETAAFALDSFDGIIIMNTLHHISVDRMIPSLEQALKLVRPSCSILVLEPLARGGSFEVMQPLDDETEVRRQALEQLDLFLQESEVQGQCRLVDTYEFLTHYPVPHASELIAMAIAVDETRRPRAAECVTDIEARFAQHAKRHDGRVTLDQPMLAFNIVKTGS